MMAHKMIGLSETGMGNEEEQAVLEVVRSGWLSQGEKVAQFEQAFQSATGLNAVAVANCTAGLHLALETLGLAPEDEVLVPGVTFVATVNAVIYAGARPVPVDIQSNVPHMDIRSAEAVLTPKTRAVMLMHYGGYRMDLPAWRDFARSHNLVLLEDAAHAPLLEDVGQFSHSAILSFFANKNMTTGEGGMILTRNADLASRLRRMRGHGMTTGTLTRARGHAWSYDVDMKGWNYRLDEMRAAMGLEQLKKLPRYNTARKRLAEHYRKGLASAAPWIHIPFDQDWPTVAHLMPVLLRKGADREAVMGRLRNAGIQSSIHYPMYHKFTWHEDFLGSLSLPNTEDWCSRTLTLPLHPGLTEEDVDHVCETMGKLDKIS